MAQRNTVASLNPNPGFGKSIPVGIVCIEEGSEEKQQKTQPMKPGGDLDAEMEHMKEREESKGDEPLVEFAAPRKQEEMATGLPDEINTGKQKEDESAQFKENVTNLQKSLKDLEGQCASHTKKHDEDSEIITSLKLEKELSTGEITKINKDLEELRKLEEEKIKLIDNLKETISSKDVLLSQHETNNIQLNNDLLTKEKDLKELHTRFDELQNEMPTKISQLTQDNEELKTKLQTVLTVIYII